MAWDNLSPAETRAALEHVCLPFGKHRGSPLLDVPTSYLRWLSANAEHAWMWDNKDAVDAAIGLEARELAAEAGHVSVTPHQQAAVDRLLNLIADGRNVVRLQGGAGYGKSYTVKAVLLALADMGYRAHACATSYVATQVLAKDLEPYGIEAATIARTLKMDKTFIDGIEEYALTMDSDVQARDLLGSKRVLAVDEDSMVQDGIGHFLLEWAARSQGVLLLIGDSAQLPPVKQDTPSVFCATEQYAELTEPMRYSRDSELFAVEQAARFNPHAIQFRESEQVHVARDGAGVFRAFAANYLADPDAAHRMLLFRRADVVAANNIARKLLFGEGAPLVTDGEKLLVLRTSDFPYVENKAPGDTSRYYSGEVYNVRDVYEDTYTIRIGDKEYSIPHYWAGMGADDVRIVFAVSETMADNSKRGGPEYIAALNAARAYGKETKNWKLYRALLDDFVHVGYNYATSVHRAQGQTVDYAYCMPSQLLKVGGLLGNALTYVALTRARKNLTVRV